jgi:hypothetical protein
MSNKLTPKEDVLIWAYLKNTQWEWMNFLTYHFSMTKSEAGELTDSIMEKLLTPHKETNEN